MIEPETLGRAEEKNGYEVHFLLFTTRISASVTGLRTAVLPSMVDGSESKRTHRVWVYVHHSCIQHSSGGAGWEYVSESPETQSVTLTVTLNFPADTPSTAGAPYVLIVLRRKPDPPCVQALWSWSIRAECHCPRHPHLRKSRCRRRLRHARVTRCLRRMVFSWSCGRPGRRCY